MNQSDNKTTRTNIIEITSRVRALRENGYIGEKDYQTIIGIISAVLAKKTTAQEAAEQLKPLACDYLAKEKIERIISLIN